MFGIGQGADCFDEGDVGVLESFCEIPCRLVVFGAMLVE